MDKAFLLALALLSVTTSAYADDPDKDFREANQRFWEIQREREKAEMEADREHWKFQEEMDREERKHYEEMPF